MLVYPAELELPKITPPDKFRIAFPVTDTPLAVLPLISPPFKLKVLSSSIDTPAPPEPPIILPPFIVNVA